MSILFPLGAASVLRTPLVSRLDRVNALFSSRGMRPLAPGLLSLLSETLPDDHF
jgi:hypothetical protein